MAACVRRAAVTDQAAIEALVRGERLNPNGIEWPGFRVRAPRRLAILKRL